jgi:hypothetical protein
LDVVLSGRATISVYFGVMHIVLKIVVARDCIFHIYYMVQIKIAMPIEDEKYK